MDRLGGKLRSFVARGRNGEFAYLRDRLATLIWSEHQQIVMRRDLLDPPPAPKAFVDFTLRPAQPGDEEALFAGAAADQRQETERRKYWLRRGLNGCHVAVLKDGTPCFVQWVLTSAENTAAAEIFEGSLPPVPPDTILLEGAYTPPQLRRLSIMPAAMARLAERGREAEARWAIVCVGDDNPSMIKAAQWAGFRPYQLKVDHLRLFRRSVDYRMLPETVAPGHAG